MPKGLKRYYGHDYLHFLTCSCYHRQPWLSEPRRRDLFLQILEQVRQRYLFVVVGYVVMPDRIHLLISEPEQGTPSTVMQVLKQRCALGFKAELWTGKIQQHHIRVFLHSFEDDLTAVRGDVEGADIEVGREVG